MRGNPRDSLKSSHASAADISRSDNRGRCSFNSRTAVPVIIRHSDPSLLSLPSLSRKIFFDINGGVSRLLISVICGTGMLQLSMSASASIGSPLGGLGLYTFTGASLQQWGKRGLVWGT